MNPQIKSNADHNLYLLTVVAKQLGELRESFTFVGGCTTALLITDPASPDVRMSVDVDCIVDVICLVDYYKVEASLREKGFKQISCSQSPICRWRFEDILIDVMPTEKSIFGFSNAWYKEAFHNAESYTIEKKYKINYLSAPYFLATKFEAFKERGKNDFFSSHDLEDIISVIDGRPSLINELENTSKQLKSYLSSEFTKLLGDDNFLVALPGHLNYTDDYNTRLEVVTQAIKDIIHLAEAKVPG